MARSADDPEAIARRVWDVIVVGTGLGGGTLGYALAKSGRSVLFCERGRWHTRSDAAVTGDYPEQRLSDPALIEAPSSAALLRDAGRWDEMVIDESRRRPRSFVPFIGCGTGGSSALYGMALERFFPADFTPRAFHPGAGDASLVDAWPVSYEELAPYYSEAEALYRVRGGNDPLRPFERQPAALLAPPPLSPAAAEVQRLFESKGLHPYRLPQACEFVPECKGCQGFLCDRGCKNDAERICVGPAVRDHGAGLLDECEATHLEADRRCVSSVRCRRRGKTLTLRGRVVVLAAGALETPRLLLRSRGPLWPQGLANESGLVGRNLMRHFIDLYLVTPKETNGPLENRHKQIAFNDFYVADGVKLGSVQSFGRLPPLPMLFASLQHDVRNGPLAPLAAALPLARPIMAPVMQKMVSGTVALATIMEDLPHSDNRVLPPEQDERLRFTYRPRSADRVRMFRRLMTDTLKPYRWQLVKQAANNERIAHACGTCRFGADANSSVLDPDNRAHGVHNLYIVDSSFFPSSGGTNPGLTIAANALRVARRIKG